MERITLVLATAGVAVVAYRLGQLDAAQHLAEAGVRIFRRTREAVEQRGPESPWTWYPYLAVFYMGIGMVIGYQFATAPRSTAAHIRAVRRLSGKRLPQEAIDAVAEAARLHLPDRHQTCEFASFQIFHGSRADLSSVAFVGTDGRVARLTLGIPGGELGNVAGARLADGVTADMLYASKLRVRAALITLAPIPDGRLRIPLTRP